jgi:hypothetical protein
MSSIEKSKGPTSEKKLNKSILGSSDKGRIRGASCWGKLYLIVYLKIQNYFSQRLMQLIRQPKSQHKAE